MSAFAHPLKAVGPSPRGEEIYSARCARCHGSSGEGTENHTARLEGDYSVPQLAEIIGETMPEDEPGTLTPAEANALAAYIHDAFYSPLARARNRPARIELARLTVEQYRRAVSDLVASFANPSEWSAERGLRGEYFNSRQAKRGQQPAAMQIDPQIDFHFGIDTPVPELNDPDAYSICWSGSLLVPETGEYEFIVHTDHAARLWINDIRRPLIDAWVKSGDETQHKASIFLVGGRPYPIRLEFTKAKQGVGNREKRKKPATEASIALWWQRPHGMPEPIRARYLSPGSAPETFVCTTPFPPDDRSYGWERGTAISQAWDECTTSAAIAAASYVTDRLKALASADALYSPYNLRTACIQFAERAFRQPLDDELVRRYVDRPFEEAGGAEAAVSRIVLLVLKSPRFLFREIGGGPSAHDAAARLSFGLWDSIPDGPLFDAARSGRLADAAAVRRQAERMLADPRAQAKLRDFLLTWLRMDGDLDLNKDSQKFPGFDANTVADLRTSLEMFLDEVVWSESSDFRQLLLAEEVFLNERLAKFYGADSNSTVEFNKVRLDDGKRAGILTHPYVMARFAYRDDSSPIHRGVFLARGLLGQSLRPPPEAFTPLAAELHPDLTTRERVALQTKDAACMTCHAIINPLGFTLERFDAVGRYRELERDKRVDDSATYQDRSGTRIDLHGPRDLAEYLAGSGDSHTAFVEQLFHHLVQQPVQAYGPETLDALRESFAAHDFNIRKLAVEIMVASALVGRDTVE
jgi:hypothetical protein